MTRERIVAAARREFERVGFARARIEDIAAEAAVAVPTVYKVFGNKRSLLTEVVGSAMRGASYAGPIDEEAWWQEQLAEPDPRTQLRLIARNARRIYERAGVLLEVMRTAATLEPQIAASWGDIGEQRMARSRRTARRFLSRASHSARFGLNETALTLWTLTAPELYMSQTGAGRSAQQYEAWLASILEASLLT
jgi:AcrR family transcriptional regulator